MAAKPKSCNSPLPIRVWHWVHITCVLILILTGAQIRFSENLHLFPNFRATIELHNQVGIYSVFTFFFWFFYYAIMSGKLGALYLPRKEEIRHGLKEQLAYYFFHFFRGRPNPHQVTPERRFNPLEKLLYLVIMLGLFPVQMVTGMALRSLYPPWKIIDLFGSIKFLMGLHFINGCVLCALIFIHVYLTTLNGISWPKIRLVLLGKKD